MTDSRLWDSWQHCDVKVLEPGPEDLNVVTFYEGHIISDVPITQYENAVNLAREMSVKFKVTLKVLCLTHGEWCKLKGWTEEEMRPDLDDTLRAQLIEKLRGIVTGNDPQNIRVAAFDTLEVLEGKNSE